VNTTDLAIIAAAVVELATIGTVGALVYTRRILLAASPKPQAAPQDKPEKKTETPPAPEAEETAALPKVGRVA
jgi:hypothetical protein